MNTVITKGNNVRQYDPDEAILCMSDIADCIAVNSNGKVIVNKGNPINWPTDAKNGLRAIVDIKAGTLRFAYDGWPLAQTDFVVSEYIEPITSAPYLIAEPFVSVEDSAMGYIPSEESVLNSPHIFDRVDNWPQAHHQVLGSEDLPEGWMWRWIGDNWVLTNGTISLKREDWFNYIDKQEAAQPVQTGTKYDHGKPILGAVPPHAELAVGRVLTFGAEKYARGNWDKVKDHENRYMDAALRHLNAHRRGELTDSESGESHLAHAACCILFMLDKQERS